MLPVSSSQKEYVAALLLFLSSLNFTSGGKLLVVPMDGSHWLSMRSVLNQLKRNGHEIIIVAPEISMHIKPSDDDIYTMKTYPVPFTKEELEESFRSMVNSMFDELPYLFRFVRTYNKARNMSALVFFTCTSLLYNQELMKYLEQSKFDALFTDPMMPCGLIVAEYLGIPSVFFLQGMPCGLDYEAAQCPSPPSYVPRLFTTYTDHMTFAERVKNLLFHMSESFLCSFAYSPYANLAAEFLQKDTTVRKLLSRGSVWLMRDDFAFDYPKPLMPNMIAIGGINCAGGKSLSQDHGQGGKIVAEYLGIPSVFFLRGIPCGLDSEAAQCPSPPSYVPRIFTTYTDHMTFAERVKNLLLHMSESFLCSFVYSPYANLAAEFLQKDTTLTKLLSHGSVLHLIIPNC